MCNKDDKSYIFLVPINLTISYKLYTIIITPSLTRILHNHPLHSLSTLPLLSAYQTLITLKTSSHTEIEFPSIEKLK